MGYLHVKDVLDLEERDRAVPQRIWHAMTTLRAELPLDDALTAMRRAASHLAAVADATGRVLGLVALEDVLEMLVGEVRDPAHHRAPAARAHRRAGDRAAGDRIAGDRVSEPREEAPLPTAEGRAMAR